MNKNKQETYPLTNIIYKIELSEIMLIKEET